MKKLNNILCSVLLLCFISNLALAGNEDRVGSAGASQLLVNPWARSTAFGDASVANASGIESSYLNIAGLTTISKTQLKVNHTNWLSSASIGNPDGGIGVFSPKSSIINFGYARLFTKNVSGGLNFKLVTESISNLSATGVAFDAGIKYTMDNERLKIGITLKNLGPKMTYSGDGLATQITYNSTGKTATLEQRSQPFEMPSLLNMGLSYDFVFDTIQKLSTMFAFTANSFSNDQYRIGLDYGFNSKNLGFNLRAGYVYEKNLLSVDNRTNSLTGFTSGFSMDFNVGKSTAIGLEYAARFSSPFGIIHTFGTTIAIK
jgi:hypothetical protein